MKIGYSRCSAAGQNHESQVDALEREGGCERIFQETASGVRCDREELAKAIEFARPGDVLVVQRLDRLGRDMRGVLKVVDQLTQKQVSLVSLGEAIDGTTPSGRLAFHMLAALSQYELEQKRIACEAGRRAAVARGRVGGRPRSLDDGKLRVARALMADNQLSMAEIARQIGCAPSTLYRTLPGGRGALVMSSHLAQVVAASEVRP
jgi:DNA invertase Pin-like site-specific DNA recombinase